MKFSVVRALVASAPMLPLAPTPIRMEAPGMRAHVRRAAENRWPVLALLACAMLLGALANAVIPPVYEANLLIQVADSSGPPKSFLGEAANVFDIKTPATAEMEIIRSRMIVAPIVEKSGLQVSARPRYYVTLGGAKINVRDFNVPAEFEGEPFIATVLADGRYSLQHPALYGLVEGRVGELLAAPIGTGRLTLLVSELRGDKGAQFRIER